MYNRYIPQADGSFQRSRVSEPQPAPLESQPQQLPRQAAKKEEAPKQAHPETHEAHPETHEAQPPHGQHIPARTAYTRKAASASSNSIGGFLKGLLPNNFDTEDLIVILLLLLISGNSSSDQNLALMTLGIYLFL